ncbi:centromere protein Chl4/mis15/CENP-N [Radiomyces spectabilis]|uniref:centromere protein Chl4/mis15/CENP-N n=1 Tax=Radiomyces spectabilis TaxID=64574 RepID=UPI00221E6262|nr:centromere protein Chl4/mis15/CENP-N [Radiomyces spectabilis]KAI8388600.1 centromere protein Chl4/mis15/CENP-N [Radiomyces spectabilis]
MHQPVYKSWKVWELKQGNNQHRAELGIDASVLRDRLQQYLNPFFSCHVLVWKQNDTDTHWVRVCMTDSMEAHTAPRSSCLAYLVHLCNTPYILFSSIASSDRKEYVIQGVLHTFAAESAQEQNLSSKRVDTLSEIVLNQTSLGVFSKFRLDQVDSNPLDYRAKPSKPLKGAEAYVSTREEKKRIVPTDKDLVKNRYTQVAESFGWNPMPNLESLQIELTVPLENESLTAMLSQTEEGHTSVAEEEDEMQMTINIKGTNVLEGMRRLILEGVLQPPIPEWMMQLASAGTDNVVVTRDGRWAQAGAEPPSPMDTENIPPIS